MIQAKMPQLAIIHRLRRLEKNVAEQNKLIRQYLSEKKSLDTLELRIIVKILFTDPPPIVDTKIINRITDKTVLQTMEKKYDTFIEKNQTELCSHDVIDQIFDMRDAILLRIGRLRRLEQKHAAFL